MEILRKLRWVLYPSAFVLVFIMASYCTFPKDVLRDMAEGSITRAALGFGPKTRGLPEVSLKDVSLWRLSGMSVNGLTIIWPPKKTEPPIVFELESLKGRVGILSLFSGGRAISADMRLYDGSLDIGVKMRPKNELGYLNVEGSKINLGKMAFMEPAFGAPVQGIFQIIMNMNAVTELSKDGTGAIKLNIDNFAYGPGSIKLPAGGIVTSLTVPKVNLGKLIADLSLDKGQIESKMITLTGGDLEADIKLSITVGRKPTSSRVSGEGWFSIKREFVNANETLKMLYDLLPALRMAQQGDGKVGITIRGNLARPDISLERYVGAKQDEKKDLVPNKSDG